MLNLIIDTGILAVPPYVQNEDDAIHVIRRIVRWSGAVSSEAPFKMLRLSAAEEHLALAGCWPVQNDIEQMLQMYNLQEVFSINDVIIAYFDLIECAIVADELETEIESISSLSISPDVLAGHGPQQIVASTHLAYGNSCYHQGVCGREIPVASGLPHKGALSLAFQATAQTFLGANPTQTPLKLDGDVRLLDLPEDLADFPSAQSIWEHAVVASDYYLALAVGCIGHLRKTGQSAAKLTDLPAFSVGTEFAQSLGLAQAAGGQTHAGVVLDTCVRVILRIPKNRVSAMGKKAQEIRTRDKALGWRTHVTKRHEALRLMFWTTGDRLELANIANKFDTNISYGVAGKEYSFAW